MITKQDASRAATRGRNVTKTCTQLVQVFGEVVAEQVDAPVIILKYIAKSKARVKRKKINY